MKGVNDNVSINVDNITVNNDSEKQPKTQPETREQATPSIPEATDGYGLTEEEIRDVNAIGVTVSNPCPVVVLFGAKTSGKTMLLVRLTRYLRAQGYRVEPDRVFRSGKSGAYKSMCDGFDAAIVNDRAAGGTTNIGFMLVTVRDGRGNPICQILEAPGEHYFDKEDTQMGFPRYINEICAMGIKRTWMFIVERNWNDASTRLAYANRIIEMQNQTITSGDKVIFVCHKADLSPTLFRAGKPNKKLFFNDIQNQYPGIFSQYMNKVPLVNLFKPYNFDFVVFSAGTFNKLQDGDQSYSQGRDFYPQELWESIRRAISGSWI